ncbi:MAG: NosD domain-containing protein [Brevinematia bacterium]
MRRIEFLIAFSVLFFLVSNLAFSQKAGVKDPYEAESSVYVSPTGSDENPGTKALPFRTIEVAIDKGVVFGVRVIKVAEGVYSPGKGLNTGFSGVAIKHHNIKLIGGYDPSFSSIVGYSILDGQKKVQAVIEVREVTNALIENFVVLGTTNRERNEKNGGGIYLNKSDYSVVRNVISSNNSVGNGAGMCIIGNNNKILDSKVIGNSGDNGGGIYLVGNYNELSSLTVQSNSASIWGGGALISGVSNTLKNSEFSYNSSREGGGIYIDKGIGNLVSDTTVQFNNSQNSGGGVFVNVGAGNTVKAIIKSNTSRDGGGVYGFKTTSLLVESSITDNSASRNGGGVFLETTYKATINSSVSRNTAQFTGGGIFIRGEENVILGSVSENIATQNGGGIYITGSKNNVKSKVQNNTSRKDGGGIYIEFSRSTKIEASEVTGNRSENIGGGIFTFRDLDTTIIDTKVVNNSSKLHGGGIAIYDSTNSLLLNIEITQNKAEVTNSIVYLYKTDGVINFIISNCTISSVPGAKGFGIFEDGLNDILLHKILDNTFVVDTLQGGLYRDFKLDATWLITGVNNPKFSGASDARGNKQK